MPVRRRRSPVGDGCARQMRVMPELRRFTRFRVSLPVMNQGAQSPENECAGVVRNVSDGGLMAEFPVRLEPGSVVRLLLRTGRRAVSVEGRIVWTAAAGAMIRHGFAFPEPRGDDLAAELFSRGHQ